MKPNAPLRRHAKPDAGPPPPKPKLDCTALLSPEDVEKECGEKIEITPASGDGRGYVLCHKKGGPGGRNLYFGVEYYKTVAEARERTHDVEDGMTRNHNETHAGTRSELAFARKGTIAVFVENRLMGEGKSGLCTPTQLAMLAKQVYERLPAQKAPPPVAR